MSTKPDPATLGAKPPSQLADTVEEEDLRHRLAERGVQVADNTTLEGLRELWATFGGGDPVDGELEPGETAEQARARLAADNDDGDEAHELTMTVTAADGTTTGPIPVSALFDDRDYQDPRLILETEDGDSIDEIIVKLNGSLTLNRKSPEAVELFRQLKRGRQAALEIRCHVAGDATEQKTQGDNGIIVASRKLRVWRIDVARVAGAVHTLSATGGGQ